MAQSSHLQRQCATLSHMSRQGEAARRKPLLPVLLASLPRGGPGAVVYGRVPGPGRAHVARTKGTARGRESREELTPTRLSGACWCRAGRATRSRPDATPEAHRAYRAVARGERGVDVALAAQRRPARRRPRDRVRGSVADA